jgi:hypothetical protein
VLLRETVLLRVVPGVVSPPSEGGRDPNPLLSERVTMEEARRLGTIGAFFLNEAPPPLCASLCIFPVADFSKMWSSSSSLGACVINPRVLSASCSTLIKSA